MSEKAELLPLIKYGGELFIISKKYGKPGEFGFDESDNYNGPWSDCEQILLHNVKEHFADRERHLPESVEKVLEAANEWEVGLSRYARYNDQTEKLREATRNHDKGRK